MRLEAFSHFQWAHCHNAVALHLQLAKQGALNLKTIRHFIIDECDKVLENIGENHVQMLLHSPVILKLLHPLAAAGLHASLVRSDLHDTAVASADMRADVQDIFKQTPHDKQVMMFSATLSQEIRPICKKFMTDVCPFSARACQPGAPSARLPSQHFIRPVAVPGSRDRQPHVSPAQQKYTELGYPSILPAYLAQPGLAVW